MEATQKITFVAAIIINLNYKHIAAKTIIHVNELKCKGFGFYPGFVNHMGQAVANRLHDAAKWY
jgi:D-serine deaminase-like pyridoxal phosphate-dependent protein